MRAPSRSFCAVRRLRPAHRARAFTLVEILVVIAIIGILLAIVFKGGTALVENARKRDTQALLAKLDLAIDEYRREVDTSRIPQAMQVFNNVPPDDLRVFETAAQPQPPTIGGCDLRMRNQGKFLLGGSAIANLNGLFDARDSDGRVKNADHLLHADIRALVLAIRLNSPKAKVILDSIDPKYWGEPDEGFEYQPGTDPSVRIRLDYLVDGWGNPLEYFSTCICEESAGLTPRERVSNAFVHENNDGPVIVSYGADGSEQFAADRLALEKDASSMIADYYEELKSAGRGVINNPLNSDNVYSSDFFANRVRQTQP